MIIMSLTTLVANAFIELNKISETKKLYLEDVYQFNEVLKEYCTSHNIGYIGQIDSPHFYELKFNYSTFFNVYEDTDGYVITLANALGAKNIENYFRLTKNEELLSILENINFENIFLKNRCLTKIKH